MLKPRVPAATNAPQGDNVYYAVKAGHVRLDLIPGPTSVCPRWAVMRLHEHIGEALKIDDTYIVRLGHPHHVSLLDTVSSAPSLWDAAGQLAEQLYQRESGQVAQRAARKGQPR